MTVCVAALAHDCQAIVLIADKALTYGDNEYQPALQGDTGVEKMLPICSSGDDGQKCQWSALIAGDATVAQDVVRRAQDALSLNPLLRETDSGMMICLKSAYQQAREQGVLETVLQPKLLTKDLVLARGKDMIPLPDAFFREVVEEIAHYALGCNLLVCGFDAAGRGHIFSVSDPGIANIYDMGGFGTLGIGQETALSRLLWLDAAKDDDVDVALYQVFDAKAHAEMIQGVGYNSDGWIMVPGKTVNVPRRIMDLINTVYNYQTRLPFKPRKGWDPIESPPENWEKTLRTFTNKVLRDLPK